MPNLYLAGLRCSQHADFGSEYKVGAAGEPERQHMFKTKFEAHPPASNRLLHYRLQACYHGAGVRLRSYVCTASTLPAEPSLQLFNNLFRSLRFHLFGASTCQCVEVRGQPKKSVFSYYCMHSRNWIQVIKPVNPPTESSYQLTSPILFFLSDI